MADFNMRPFVKIKPTIRQRHLVPVNNVMQLILTFKIAANAKFMLRCSN
jgi:hypothetical protein